MGKYINIKASTFEGRCRELESLNALPLGHKPPNAFIENLVCVVDNGMFAAAAYVFDEREFRDFTLPTDNRHKAWFTLEGVKELAH